MKNKKTYLHIESTAYHCEKQGTPINQIPKVQTKKKNYTYEQLFIYKISYKL